MEQTERRALPEQLIEEGAAFHALKDRAAAPAGAERFDVIVIGGGQAGLSVGYHLSRRGLRFVILDASARIGDAWRRRWDSLRLFTPAKLDGLDGMPFPAPPDSFPTKDEMGDYLESYANHFRLPVRSGVRVQSLTREDGRYVVQTEQGCLTADHVVIAMANFQRPRVPALGAPLDAGIVQIHSSAYKNPAQLREGPVLVAGAGNSGSELAMELARRGHRVFMSGRDTGHIPFRIDGFWARLLLTRLFLRGLFHYLLTVRTLVGRKARRKVIDKGGPLIRVKPRELRTAGVERVPRTVGVQDGRPVLEDGRVLDVANVVWCTGYERSFEFVQLPVFEPSGEPLHDKGVAIGQPGLYFVGLHFLYSLSSTMVHGVGRDAARIVDAISTASASEAV